MEFLMGHYYFDVIADGRKIIDEDGDELRDAEQARTWMRLLLAEQVSGLLRHHCAGQIAVSVRDITGPCFGAKVTVSAE